MMRCTVNMKLYTVTKNLGSLTETVWGFAQYDLWLNVIHDGKNFKTVIYQLLSTTSKHKSNKTLTSF